MIEEDIPILLENIDFLAMLTFQVHEQKACFLHICIVLTLFKSRTYSFKCTNLVCLCVDLFIPRILFFSTQLKIEISFFLSFSLFSLLRQLIAFLYNWNWFFHVDFVY